MAKKKSKQRKYASKPAASALPVRLLAQIEDIDVEYDDGGGMITADVTVTWTIDETIDELLRVELKVLDTSGVEFIHVKEDPLAPGTLSVTWTNIGGGIFQADTEYYFRAFLYVRPKAEVEVRFSTKKTTPH